MNKRMIFTPAVKAMLGIINEIKNVSRSGLDLQPKYQRDYIWKDEFKDKLIYSIVRGYPIGSISISVLNRPNEKKAMSEVVDGQQRLTTIYNFVEKGYEIKHEYARKICEDIVDYLADITDDKELDVIKKKLESQKRFRLTYKMLPQIIKGNVESYQLSISNISESTREQISEYFRFLQNQEILRAGEILHSLPETAFKEYLDTIEDPEKFKAVIGFKKDNRREFDKIFYGSIGVLDQSINFGSPDKVIKNYITSTHSELTDESKKRVTNLVLAINEISTFEEKLINDPSKRFLKFLFLLLGFGKFTFEHGDRRDALKKLSEINKRLPAFTSAKKNIIDETFAIFKELPTYHDIIEDYRQISLFSRGIQVSSTTTDRIELLHNILSRELRADFISKANSQN